MSAKSQHNNILLAILGFTTVVIIVGLVGYFLFKEDPEVIQGSIEVSEYRMACKLPGRIVDLKVKEGDHVLYSKYGAMEVKYDGEEYLIMRQNDILAIIKD